MKIEEMSISEIEEYIKDNLWEDEVTNLYMCCLECNEYFPLSECDVESELCNNCYKKIYTNDNDDNDFE